MSPNEIHNASLMPEYESIEAFVEDNEDGMFTSDDLNIFNYRFRLPIKQIKAELESYGLRLQLRERERNVRGFHANSHDRWDGPGSCQSHGGGGNEQIMGFAGRRG